MRLNFFSLICVRVKGLLIRGTPFFSSTDIWVKELGHAIGVLVLYHTARDTRGSADRRNEKSSVSVRYRKALMMERGDLCEVSQVAIDGAF